MKLLWACVLVLTCTLLAPMSASATDYVGTVCFKFTDFTDTWKLDLESVGGISYQLSGRAVTHDGALSGNLVISPGTVFGRIVLTEADANGDRAIFAASLDFTTWTGTASWHWINASGTIFATWLNKPFGYIPCPASPAAAAEAVQPSSKDAGAN